MSRLYIFGDSFSVGTNVESPKCWFNILATKLGNIEIINRSVYGGCQDWVWDQLHQLYNTITPDDYVVIVLTHPGRFWYIDEDPSISKVDSTLPSNINPELQCAIKNYFQYIQRPKLDTIWLENRLAWLAYSKHLKGWKKPLVILAFEQDFTIAKTYPDIKFSKGNLFEHVSIAETGHSKLTMDDYAEVLDEFDPRYNHMCLSNHVILGDKIYQNLINNIELNLTTGFKSKFVTKKLLSDNAFIEKELDPVASKIRIAKSKTWNYLERFKI
jgi:hypothetical protein